MVAAGWANHELCHCIDDVAPLQASQFSHAFWMGDLNYRVNIKSLPGHEGAMADFEKEWSTVHALVEKVGPVRCSSLSSSQPLSNQPDQRWGRFVALPSLAANPLATNLIKGGAGTLPVFGWKSALEDAIGSDACSLEALACL
jgi:hypothetical protein